MEKTDTKKVIEFLTEKWGDKDCPMCNKGPWQVQDKLFQLSEYHQGSLIVGGPLIPVIPVTCTNCGHTILVNGIISGAIPPETKATEENK